MNKKGFTLIELLVAVTILGIIMGIALPQMSNLQQQNKQTKYKKYAETMLSSAKLYTDSYAFDMFGYNTSGCVDKTVSELEEKGLIKDIKVSGDSCITDETKVYIRKVNDYYIYETSIKCVDKKGLEVYREDYAGGPCLDKPDGDGPIIQITPNATTGWINSVPANIKIKVSDVSGMLENTKIKITLKKDGVVVASEEKEHNFKNKRYEGTTSHPLEYNYKLPSTLSGIFSITVTPISVRDGMGNYTTAPVDSGEYKVDTEPPTCEVSGGSTTWINASSSTKSRVIKAHCTDSGGSGCVTADFSHTYSTSIDTTKAGAKGNNSGGSVSDAAGNVTNCPANQTVKIDPTPPTCTNRGDSTEWTSGNRTIYYGCDDGTGSGCNTSHDGGSTPFSTTTKTATIAAYTIKDNAGNTTNCPARNANVYVDKDDPTCTNRGDSTTWTDGNRTIYYGCDDGAGSGCDSNHDGGSTPFSTTTKTTTISAYTIKDNVGNSTNCPARTANVYVDKTAPSAPTINLSSSGETSSDVTFTLSSVSESNQSGVDKRQYKIGSGSWTDYSGGSITLLTNTGAKTVYARTIDNVGNTSANTTATGKCDKDQVSVERVSNRTPNGECYFTLQFTNNNTLSGTSGYDYVYWNPKQTTDTENLGNGNTCTTNNDNLNSPRGLNLYKTSGTITGNTIELRQYYSKQYYCLAVRPHRNTEISSLNRWTVQHKHAITGSSCS